KEGYLVNKETGCKLACVTTGENKNCKLDCKNQGGSKGYCLLFRCFCEGLSESTPTFPIPGKTCSGK
uniref:Toxin NaTx-4 n=2 Tax=Centruroides sculpturatus TaxID=218467 RepID=NATX4_CENSC